MRCLPFLRILTNEFPSQHTIIVKSRIKRQKRKKEKKMKSTRADRSPDPFRMPFVFVKKEPWLGGFREYN
jgi:hypothetical protein